MDCVSSARRKKLAPSAARPSAAAAATRASGRSERSYVRTDTPAGATQAGFCRCREHSPRRAAPEGAQPSRERAASSPPKLSERDATSARTVTRSPADRRSVQGPEPSSGRDPRPPPSPPLPGGHPGITRGGTRHPAAGRQHAPRHRPADVGIGHARRAISTANTRQPGLNPPPPTIERLADGLARPRRP